MRKGMLWWCAIAFAGCASATKVEREAKIHDMRADAAGRMRDYDRAAAEKAEAERLHAKAVKRSYKEGTTDQVVIPTAPAEVPHEPPPIEPVP